MQEKMPYAECTKDELIQIILDQNRTIEELKKEVESLKHPVHKDSTNSSIPTSKEMIPRTRSQREKSGKKPGGQVGHKGQYRERNSHPDSIVVVEASHCRSCGASLEGIEGTIGQIAQQIDIAQNKTPAGKHQLCHAHLLRNLGVSH